MSWGGGAPVAVKSELNNKSLNNNKEVPGTGTSSVMSFFKKLNSLKNKNV